MNADPSFAIQAAIMAALSGSSDLAALIGTPPRVYDTVPVGPGGVIGVATFPYVTIGDDHIVGDSDEFHDASEAHVMVEAWSRGPGFPEVKRIAGVVRGVLSAPLDLTPNGHRAITAKFESLMFRREPDGLTRRAIILFRVLTQPL